jgi:ABC-2 type transport system permease protein
MLHLLNIDLKKLTSYRTFWVVIVIYFSILLMLTTSGMAILTYLANKGAQLGADINVRRVPLYHFPDVWQNMIWISGFLKFVLGVLVIVSVTNEYAYRTVRQNIIDGLSRWEFLQSKILTNVVLAAVSTVGLFIISLVAGLIMSPELRLSEIFDDVEFFPAYFLQVFGYLSFALMISMLIQYNVFEDLPVIQPFFPLESIEALITLPFERYWFQEILDHPLLKTVLLASFWTFMFNYFAYLKLKKADI